jgi:hypothetical protein
MRNLNPKVKTTSKVALVIVFSVFIAGCKKEEISLSPWYPEKNEMGEGVLWVFESRVPCHDCERVKLALVLYGDPQTSIPTTYKMARVYVGRDNNRLTNDGNVTITQGTSLSPQHTVYQLTTNAPTEYKIFWKINEDLLFILNEDLTPRLGDAGHGYVLNRTR